MGTPGSVDHEAGTVIGAYNLNWKTLQPVREQIEKGTGIKFTLDNDANVAALGERWQGAGDNKSRCCVRHTRNRCWRRCDHGWQSITRKSWLCWRNRPRNS